MAPNPTVLIHAGPTTGRELVELLSPVGRVFLKCHVKDTLLFAQTENPHLVVVEAPDDGNSIVAMTLRRTISTCLIPILGVPVVSRSMPPGEFEKWCDVVLPLPYTAKMIRDGALDLLHGRKTRFGVKYNLAPTTPRPLSPRGI